jgi:hypothetical protein
VAGPAPVVARLIGDRGAGPAAGPTAPARVVSWQGTAPPVPSKPRTDLPPAPVTIARLPASQPAGPPLALAAPPTPVQRVEADPPASAPEPVVQAVAVRRADPPAAPVPPAAPATQAPEELLDGLFDPLLRRLRAELRIERDRRGALTDLRH